MCDGRRRKPIVQFVVAVSEIGLPVQLVDATLYNFLQTLAESHLATPCAASDPKASFSWPY
jgi:hypothetical protein